MSSRELMAKYLAERARLGVLVPLALLLAAAGFVFNPRAVPSFSDFVDSTVQALLFVLAFRVWDDLEDRERDAREHPDRVLVTTQRTAPFVLLALIFAGVAAIPVVVAPQPLARLASVSAAIVVSVLWYRLRPAASAGLLNGHVVLLKYPAIAFAVAPARPSPVALASLYLVLCVYEAFDDPALRASITARRVALTELVLVPLIIATASLLGGGPL